MLRQWVCFRDHERCTVKGSCMGFADFLQVRYENHRIDDTTRERRYYEWVAQNYEFDNNRTPSTTTVSDKYPYKTNHSTPIPLDEWDTSFDIDGEYAKEIGNPYSRRFDEYKRVFDNEVEQLSNEYTLRIGKKGMSWMMFGRNASNTIEKLSILGTTKDSKKMSYGEGANFICITKQDDDALPLGRVNGARFKAMIRKELKDKGIAHDET
ncbi:hypothetical protein Tco_1485814 [Tanacetum coccineum]